MIAHDLSAKNKKSLQKSLVQVPVLKESEESDSKEFEDSDAEKAGTDSPNEEIENRKNINSDDQTSSGVEGDESDANDDVDQSNNNDKSNANLHWADAMKKILNTKKPKRKKSVVLSKAKKLNDLVPKPKEIVVPFEVESKEGEIKRETIKIEENIEPNQNNVKLREQRRKIIGKRIRVKPSVLDRDYEKRLQKIATNGVVQLFNAVRQQQKEIQDKLVEAGPLERKREKALKTVNRKAFLDVLMGGTNNLVDDAKESNKDEHDGSEQKDHEVWNVLRDDFVMGAKLKDWNKHNTSDEDSSDPEEMDSD